MTVKLALLKSGEDIIADIHEMVVGEEDSARVVGYFLQNPCVVKLYGDRIESDGKEKKPSKIQLTPWMPLSFDERIPISSDWLVTMVEPISQLKTMYENGVKKNEKRNSKNTSNTESNYNISN